MFSRLPLALFATIAPHNYLSYDAASDGGERRGQHYIEFKTWLQERYAEYGKVNTFFR